MILPANRVRTGALVVIATVIAHGILLLSLAHAYPWQPWSTLAWTAVSIFVACVVGATAFATILIAWASAQ